MDKNNRPVGREKRVGSGIGDTEKRGDGLSGRTNGPVGNHDGYSDRPENSSDNQSSSSNSGFGGPFSQGLGKSASSGGSLKSIIIFIIIAIGLYYLYNHFIKAPKTVPGQNNPGITNSQSGTTGGTFYDKGAYAVDTTVSNLAREKRTVLKGNGEDQVTIMVYMCATDLEAESGMASTDIQEMLYAEASEKVNIILETGGTSKWQNKVISNRTNQRYRLRTDGLELLEDNMGRKSMVNPNTLTDFIQFSKKKFPADRYILIMWDHGGGSLKGFGYDEYFKNDSMTLDEIATALKNGGCYFDMVGFDACLMGTLETALVLEPYADYMIASEETEPDLGWYHTGWISALSKNTSLPTINLGKIIIDDYVKDVGFKIPDCQATLSLTDLSEIKGTVPSSFSSFASSTKELLDAEKYKKVSDARAGAKEFSPSSEINQIDLVHFAENIGTNEAKSFSKVLRGCIKYNRSTSNVTNAYGLSIFFPYERLSMLSPMLETYDEIGIDRDYKECIRSFASVAAGGQVVASSSNNMLETLLNGLTGNTQITPKPGSSGGNIIQQLLTEFLSKGDFSSITGLLGNSLGWLDIDRMKESIGYYKDNQLDGTALVITEKDDQRVLALTEKQWEQIQHMEMNVFLDDGKGFIDLGLDNVFEYNDDGDLIMEYDGTWLALNGNIVSYYMTSDDRHGERYSTMGRIPALLNDQLVDIIVAFDNENPYGKVLGAQKIYKTESKTETVAKGLLKIEAGDQIDFLCDYYTYKGKYSDTYMLGKRYTATGQWKIENISVGNKKYQMTYRLTDIYNNHYWTPSITK